MENNCLIIIMDNHDDYKLDNDNGNDNDDDNNDKTDIFIWLL